MPSSNCRKIYSFLFAIFLVLHLNAYADGVLSQMEGTLVLRPNQWPRELVKTKGSTAYLIYEVSLPGLNSKAVYDRWFSNALTANKDTVLNFSRFSDSLRNRGSINGYRIIFGNENIVDSIYELNENFRIVCMIYPIGNALRILVYDTAKKISDRFDYDYKKRLIAEGQAETRLSYFLRRHTLVDYYGRKNYTLNSVWSLSIGIDDYGDIRMLTCKSDALAYDSFFRSSYASFSGTNSSDHYIGKVLLDSQATKKAILSALKEIASRANPNDYFIFNFGGGSNYSTVDSVNFNTYFFPFDVIGSIEKPVNRKKSDTSSPFSNLISLKELQEHIQLIPCTRQLFISEAGPSEKFKTEFIRTMMQNSPAIASLLNINRVIIVPNHIGYDNIKCNGEYQGKAPLTYCITSLKGKNIFDLFADDTRSEVITALLKGTAFECGFYDKEYFDVFFEKKFLQQYREILGDEQNQTRGGKPVSTEALKIEAFSGERYALIIGTDTYKGQGWDKLNNPVYDATEIAGVLQDYYNYKVKLLTDAPMDSIYSALRKYYQQLKPNDQLIIYIGGHGDFDAGLLDDGFIVCSDSRSVEDDPLRNSYIQHTKLKKMINKIPAKQVLVLLDICHGGTFDEDVLGKTRDNPISSISNLNILEMLKEKSQYTTRKVLSSVGKESAFDGKAGKHSPFAAYLLNILLAGGGAQGILTLSDIYAVLQKASLNETATLKISPHVAGFGDNDPLSEFILIPYKKAIQ